MAKNNHLRVQLAILNASLLLWLPQVRQRTLEIQDAARTEAGLANPALSAWCSSFITSSSFPESRLAFESNNGRFVGLLRADRTLVWLGRWSMGLPVGVAPNVDSRSDEWPDSSRSA